jgi:hypothetical protein
VSLGSHFDVFIEFVFAGVSQKMDPPAASYTKDAGESSGTSKPSSSGTSPAPKQPIWYRFRTALTTLLVMNAVIVGKR